MGRRNPQRFDFATILIDHESAQPLYRQLEDQLRDAILQGRIAPGERLPATRRLSGDLHVGRNTVSQSYERLIAEGYLQAEIGSGTRVSTELPETLLNRPQARKKKENKTQRDGALLSQRGKQMFEFGDWNQLGIKPPRPFRPHVPALDLFPRHIWQRLSERRLRRLSRDLWGTGDSQGYRPLRQAIADYLKISRGVNCCSDQILITAGAQQGLELVSRLLLDPGDTAWIEEPGYTPARLVFELNGARVVSIPVDEEGLIVSEGVRQKANARLAYITPGSHWPLGMTMSLSRRLELLNWAQHHSGWILEDDYNSEFRYDGRPLPSIQGLDQHESVLYMGTFSKVLFPGLRLGYLVIPAKLVNAFVGARWLADRHSPPFEQAVLTDFIEEGHFERHVRKMRTSYASRQAALSEAIRQNFGDEVHFSRTETGLQLVVYGANEKKEAKLRRSADQLEIEYHPVSFYASPGTNPAGMILGFAAFTEEQIENTIRSWAMNYLKRA
ncbi:PLP-dependent aminotransferase family protein [Gimesia aquarii]|uniref:HTH-type transcriptional regulatory protein GabR n=1 Tax=Gimesia aquarii TaxID=2527964 RepID=A0A517WY74_9PLAN|nr:PLP-dependent aminotransferase family protein [Gimesia aquarii]QDU10201.1 HTH-type transcriptional regulatory protein GabR [Gimesia aquarii]